MIPSTRSSLTAAVACLAALAAPAAASAAEVYISNPTSYNITYSVRYGDGAWKQQTLCAGHCTTWSVADNGQSFTVCFSTNIGNGGGNKEYCLNSCGSYAFGKTGCGCYLNLFRK